MKFFNFTSGSPGTIVFYEHQSVTTLEVVQLPKTSGSFFSFQDHVSRFLLTGVLVSLFWPGPRLGRPMVKFKTDRRQCVPPRAYGDAVAEPLNVEPTSERLVTENQDTP